jgi:hypothetical protein
MLHVLLKAEIKQRRMRLLGHVMRMTPNIISNGALHWTPPVKRKRDRPISFDFFACSIVFRDSENL